MNSWYTVLVMIVRINIIFYIGWRWGYWQQWWSNNQVIVILRWKWRGYRDQIKQFCALSSNPQWFLGCLSWRHWFLLSASSLTLMLEHSMQGDFPFYWIHNHDYFNHGCCAVHSYQWTILSRSKIWLYDIIYRTSFPF